MEKYRAYRIDLSLTAEKTYRDLFEKAKPHLDAGNTTHPIVKRLRLVDEYIDTIIPHEPFSKEKALSGILSTIFRVKKGRMRICYIGSSTANHIIVLYISETDRKDGDKNDPYIVFSKMILSGKFDKFFDALGMKRPHLIAK